MFGIVLCCLHVSAETQPTEPRKIMVLGDSLSAAYGIDEKEGWVSLLTARIDKSFMNWKVVNVSVSGETTSMGKDRIDSELKQHKPHIVVVELGGNDGLRGYPVQAVEKELRTIVKKCLESGAQVLLVGMRLPPNYGDHYTEDFYAMYSRIAKDLKTGYTPFLLENVGGEPELMQLDGVHPKANAQPILLDNVWPEIKRMISSMN